MKLVEAIVTRLSKHTDERRVAMVNIDLWFAVGNADSVELVFYLNDEMGCASVRVGRQKSKRVVEGGRYSFFDRGGVIRCKTTRIDSGCGEKIAVSRQPLQTLGQRFQQRIGTFVVKAEGFRPTCGKHQVNTSNEVDPPATELKRIRTIAGQYAARKQGTGEWIDADVCQDYRVRQPRTRAEFVRRCIGLVIRETRFECVDDAFDLGRAECAFVGEQMPKRVRADQSVHVAPH